MSIHYLASKPYSETPRQFILTPSIIGQNRLSSMVWLKKHQPFFFYVISLLLNLYVPSFLYLLLPPHLLPPRYLRIKKLHPWRPLLATLQKFLHVIPSFYASVSRSVRPSVIRLHVSTIRPCLPKPRLSVFRGMVIKRRQTPAIKNPPAIAWPPDLGLPVDRRCANSVEDQRGDRLTDGPNTADGPM